MVQTKTEGRRNRIRWWKGIKKGALLAGSQVTYEGVFRKEGGIQIWVAEGKTKRKGKTRKKVGTLEMHAEGEKAFARGRTGNIRPKEGV